MDALHIPETATETYLERLAENIIRQIERSQNKKIRAHLDLMLETVYARLQEKRRESQKFPQREEQDGLEVLELTDEFQEDEANNAEEAPPQNQQAKNVTEQADVLLLTELIEEGQLAAANDDFSTQEHQVVKDRLREVVQKVQERKNRAPEENDDVILADVMREISPEEPIASDDLSSEVKERLKRILVMKNRLREVVQKVQERKNRAPEEDDDVILADVMREISTEEPIPSKALSSEIKKRLKRILGAVQAQKQPSSEDAADIMQTLTRSYRSSVEPEADVPGENQEGGAPEQTTGVVAAKAFQPLSKDEQFIDICKKISTGHSIELFQSMPLSDREQDILNAMSSQLNSYKGLKKQQVFEMQHLTARSIHELDLIFKTYHIQGYLKAELTNVYNRLLNIRGRFSMLLN